MRVPWNTVHIRCRCDRQGSSFLVLSFLSLSTACMLCMFHKVTNDIQLVNLGHPAYRLVLRLVNIPAKASRIGDIMNYILFLVLENIRDSSKCPFGRPVADSKSKCFVWYFPRNFMWSVSLLGQTIWHIAILTNRSYYYLWRKRQQNR